MPKGNPILPKTINTDISAENLPENVCRFIKNMTIKKGANGTIYVGHNEEKQKPLQANEIYAPITVPTGTSYCFSSKYFDVVNEIYCWCWNSEGNHFLYRILCGNSTVQMIKIDKNFNFQLSPEYFIHECASALELIKVVDPATGDYIEKRDLYWTDNFNYQCYLRIEDCIASNGFDESTYPLFSNFDYNRDILIRMGIPTPKNCLTVVSSPITDFDKTQPNGLLYQSIQFRISVTDVYGRPSVHSIISDLYIPGINDCFTASSSLSRCVDISFNIDNPLWDTVDIEYAINNSTQWYTSDTLFLYIGSPLGQWWLRPRNSALNFSGNTVTYHFCLNSERIPIDPNETDLLDNALPMKSEVLLQLGSRICLANNEDGFTPVPVDEKQKVQVIVEPPTSTQSDLSLRNITIYMPIWNQGLNNYQSVRQDGTNGFIWGDNDSKHGGARRYQQYFKNTNQSGFLGYLVGGNSVVSTQVYLSANGTLVDDPEHTGMDASPTHFTMQKFVFTNLPKGNYVFRLASTLFDTSVGGAFELTSTTIWGACPFSKNSDGSFAIGTGQRLNQQELHINVCDADYDTLLSGQMLLIADLAFHVSGIQNNNKATDGYIYSTRKNGFNQNPVELTYINPDGRSGIYSLATDHNGFYWGSSREAGRTFNVRFKNKCIDANINIDLPNGDDSGLFNQNIYIDEYNNEQYADYPDTACNFILVQGQILLGTIGVPNVPVILTRGGVTTTDDDGNFSIIAHDDIRAGTRNDSVIVANGICYYTNTQGGCIEPQPITIQPCSTCVSRVVTVTSFLVAYTSVKGLLSGGRYGIGFNRFDWSGRISALQDMQIISMPTIIDTQVLAPSRVHIIIPTNFSLPLDTDYITIGLTKELSVSAYISWIVDSFIFIDNTGQENLAAPTQIKIYYQSLNEYNKQNNFNTTTNWQFLEALPNATTTPFTNDVVQFYINGDGTFFPKLITALIKYDQTGQYFLIDYTSDLANLKANAYIRLVRPNQQTSDTQPFYETCKIIPVVNGVPTITDFYLNAFDTYYVPRQIPVPTNADPTGTTTTTTNTLTTNNPDGSVTAVVTTVNNTLNPVNELRTFGFQFEHDSPSNFWGKGVQNIGRENVKNPYENKIIHINQAALSGVISPNSQLSYLQWFDDTLKTNFDVLNTGGIIAAMVIINRILWVTQHGNFMTYYNDNLLRIQGGNVAASTANAFSNPEAVGDYEYGVLDIDKNTVAIRKDMIVFVDRTLVELIGLRPTNSGGSIHFTKACHDIIFAEKVKSMYGTNRYFHKGINTLTDEYLLTDFNLDSISYINQERWYDAASNETISFDLNTGALLSSFSFTPESYAYADGDISQKNLISFQNAIPYRHYTFNPTLFNTFYGVVCERVFVVVSNGDLLGEKLFQYMEFYSKWLFFSPQVTTDSGQLSRINKSRWLRSNKFYKAAFMRDLNTPDVNNRLTSKLFEGNPLYGRYIVITLVGDAKDNQTYTDVSGIVVYTGVLDKSAVP